MDTRYCDSKLLSEFPEELMNYPVYYRCVKCEILVKLTNIKFHENPFREGLRDRED
jgi:hypothetical protein